mmetsp:Transcript_89910/g.279832  ORF Transcript_89910/g.279832 Transcript_89910/m.279832 type:complete len:210 (+) Transcript_89910:57-686(+)
MARLLLPLLGLCLCGCATAGLFSECPSSLNTGAVGSCVFSDCSPSRGPTHCKWGSCYCDDGYCRYPAGTVHIQSRYCVARIPGATCHLTRFCWSGGLTESFCEKGLCMCKWGYHAEKSVDDNGQETYACVAGTSELATAVARNATGDEIEQLLEHQSHSDRMGALNLAIASLWACGCALALALAVGAGVVVTRRRNRKVSVSGFGELLG